MAETHTVHDPFLGKSVEVSDRLVDRLRGKYAVGPHLPNGDPEFGWRQFEAPPIQHEAADEIERLREALEPFAALALIKGGTPDCEKLKIFLRYMLEHNPPGEGVDLLYQLSSAVLRARAALREGGNG